MKFPRWMHWRAEGLRLRRQPLAWMALGALLLALLASATSAGLQARAWREASVRDGAAMQETLRETLAKPAFSAAASPARAIATYHLGRGDLGATRMPVEAGLGLGVHRLELLAVRLKASLDNRQVEARNPGPLKNPMLSETGLPGVPAMAALLIPLVALVLCAGLLQEEREQGRLGLLRVQSTDGLAPVLAAALGWRLLAIWAVSAVGTAPSLWMDPGSTGLVAAQWVGALGAFCAIWVVLGGLLSVAPISAATSFLAALGMWLALTFALPAGIVMAAHRQAPTPSRLNSIIAIRDAQHESEEHEQALAQAWYGEHPQVPAQLPAVWPASFTVRALDQSRSLQPVLRAFSESRNRQAAFVARWSWTSPGLALVLWGERLAGTDAGSHERYLQSVDAFEQRWRDFLVPQVMSLEGISAGLVAQLPRFEDRQESAMTSPPH